MKLKIISDGTNAGTKLIDEDTGEMVHLIQKLTWEADAAGVSTKVTIELLNVPVEIITKAEVDLFQFIKENEYKKPIHSKTFDKEIKIVSTTSNSTFSPFTKVFDTITNEAVGAIQKIKWTATPKGAKTKIRKIFFDKKEW